MQIIFWASVSLLFYAFVGYPLILKVWATLFSRKHFIDENYQPSVSIVLSVYNEEDVIKEKVENFLAIDYPEDRLEFVIVSDQCGDRTEEIIRSFENSRIKLLVQQKRSGKTLNLNRGVAEARGEIIVFTDANSMFHRHAVKKLVRHFKDPAIGLVSGRSIYLDSADNSEMIGGAFRSYEEMLKRGESSIGSIVGADGAIYAIRKCIYEPLDPKYINDFIHTIQIVNTGFRAISDDEVTCFEVVDESYSGELSRQTRMMAQSWLILFSQIPKLVINCKFMYIWEFFSHKVFRWLTFPLMLIVFFANFSILEGGVIFEVSLFVQLIFYVFALVGGVTKSQKFRFPFFFVMVHYASLLGLFRLFSGNVYATWNPRND